jgi:hypothetical protein
LNELAEKKIILKKQTYEYNPDIKSINMYVFPAAIKMPVNLFYLKINLVKPEVFISNNSSFSRGVSYLNVNKIMLVNILSDKEFNLKNLNLLYKLFSTEYVLDRHFYEKIYQNIVDATPGNLPNTGDNNKLHYKNVDISGY